MAEKEKSAEKFIKTFIKYFTAAVVFLFVIPMVFFYTAFCRTWYVFTEKRVETLEEIFHADFPDGTDFIKYRSLYSMDGSTDWLYIGGVSDPETFCRDCINIPIEFMADIKYGKVLEYGGYAEDESANEIEYFSQKKESWKNEERYIDFLCKCKTGGTRKMFLYFFKNGNGYDVKMMMY